MKLEKLKLHNYRCFEDLEVEFNPKLTVIVGTNGAGKSTILDAAASAVSGYLAGFDGVGLYKIEPKDACVKTFEMGTIVDTQPQYPVCIEAKGVIFGNSIQWKREKKGQAAEKKNAKVLEGIRQYGSSVQAHLSSGSTLVAPIIVYYGTGRLWNQDGADDLTQNTTRRQDAYKDCLDAHLSLKSITTWFEKMTYLSLQNGSAAPQFSAVVRAMEKVFALVAGVAEVAVRCNLQTHEIEVNYTSESGEKKRLFVSQLSDGYRSTICLIADIAYRMAVLNPQLLGNVLTETDGIVLIDEIDLHLHPAWQQRILGDLQEIFPKVQFIVSTHAPAVVNTVKSDFVVILGKEGLFVPDGEVYGKDISRIVQGVMDGPSRPEAVKTLFDDFYAALKRKDYAAAERYLVDLDGMLEDDEEVAACHIKLKLRRRMG